MSDTLKERLARWWKDRKQVQALANAGVVKAKEFDISEEYGQQMIEQKLAQISDLESAREAVNLLCKLDIAGAQLDRHQLHRLLDQYIPLLQDIPQLDEWDELLFMFPSHGPEEFRRLLGLLESRQNRVGEPPTFLLARVLEQARGEGEIVDYVARLIDENLGYHSYLLQEFPEIRQHPQLRQTARNSRSVYEKSILLQDAGPAEWEEIFRELIRHNPDYAMEKLQDNPPPEGVRLTERVLLPALTSSNPAVRERGLRALQHFSAPEKPDPTRQKRG